MMKGLERFLDTKRNLYLALLLPAILIYFKSLHYGFTTLDEQWLVVRSSNFNSDWSNLLTVFHTPVSFVYYRPLFIWSLIIDHHIGEISPTVYHVTNLLWHLLAIILLYRFLVLTGSQKVKAYIITLLFSLHPIAVHAVAWIPGRNDLMLACFTLLSFNSLLVYLQQQRKLSLLLHFLFLVCALLTKESAVVIPFICGGIIYAFSKKKPIFYLSYFALAMTLMIVYLFLRAGITDPLPSTERTLWLNVKDIFLAFFMQLGKAYYPISQSVSPILRTSLSLFGILVFILTLVLWKRSKLDLRKSFLAWFIFISFMLLPLWFGVAKGSGEHYEHRIYCSLIGLALFFSCFDLERLNKTFQGCVFAVLVVFAITTSLRMKVYANEKVFVDAGIKERPDYYLFYLQKGDQHNKVDPDKAIEFYTKAIELRPGYAFSYANRGTAFYHAHKYKEAVEDYDKATIQLGYNESVYLNRCYCNARLGNVTEAKNDLDSLEKYSPQMVDPQLKQVVNEMLMKQKGL